MTNQTACCRAGHTESGSAIGDWYFPDGSRAPIESNHVDFRRTRGKMVVRLNRRRGGEDGIYRCVIPDSVNVIQTIYIGVYTANIGK